MPEDELDGPGSDPTPPDPTDDPTAPDPTDSHRDDGLDLARAIAKAVRGSGLGPARSRKRRKGPPPKARASGAHPDDRDPQLLGNTVDRLVSDHGWEVDLRVQGVFARWAEIVGPEVGAHCTPESFADGRLVARTDSTAWATQLKLLAPTVVRRLNEELGHDTVTFIEVLGPHAPTWKKGYFNVRGRGPRDTYG